MLIVASALWSLSAGCGGDVCEEAWEKQQACAEALNCKTMDPSMRNACDAAKAKFSVNYTLYKVNQEKHGFDMTCEGDNKLAAEGFLACTLSPQLFCEQCQ